MDMDTEFVRASHTSYLAAVVAELNTHEDLAILNQRFTGGGTAPRTAEITLQPTEGPYAEEDVTLVWDEVYGWKTVVPAEAGASDWYMGMAIVPTPAAVANWADMMLSRPDLTPSRDDGPTRSPEEHDPALESALANYHR